MISATILMILALSLFLVESVIFPISDVAAVISTATAIIGVFAIWFQMKRERDINEAEFILNFNEPYPKCVRMIKA